MLERRLCRRQSTVTARPMINPVLASGQAGTTIDAVDPDCT
jgi:hypothetical protein